MDEVNRFPELKSSLSMDEAGYARAGVRVLGRRVSAGRLSAN
jgi:hypothetical protein